MANRRLVDIQREAIEARSRLTVDRWDGVQLDVQMRLSALKQLIGQSSDTEIHRHVVVSLVAALQTYFRGTVISICKLDEKYRIRAAEMIPDKFSMKDALGWIGGASTSYGELVAHMASCNSPTDIVSWLDGLLATSLKTELANAVSEYDQRNGIADAKLLVPNVDEMLAVIARAFQLRHILAHEAASTLRISTKSCSAMWEAVSLFINGVNAVLWATAYRDMPLTQFEMNMHASREVGEAQSAMDAALEEAKSNSLTGADAAWLTEHQHAWLSLTTEWYANTFAKLDGTMWPSVAGVDRAAAIRARAAQISMWATVLQPDGDAASNVLKKFENWFDDEVS